MTPLQVFSVKIIWQVKDNYSGTKTYPNSLCNIFWTKSTYLDHFYYPGPLCLLYWEQAVDNRKFRSSNPVSNHRRLVGVCPVNCPELSTVDFQYRSRWIFASGWGLPQISRSNWNQTRHQSGDLAPQKDRSLTRVNILIRSFIVDVRQGCSIHLLISKLPDCDVRNYVGVKEREWACNCERGLAKHEGCIQNLIIIRKTYGS